ncbi:MAG: energy transducer TonB [Pyrinomonadaceae bacterium]
MKYCPTCKTRYDEEILRFCMKDGTPLIEEDEPVFIQMPSESIDDPEDDDPAEVTIIRKNIPAPPPPNAIDEISFTPDATPSAQRIVVPTTDEPASGQPRSRVIPPYQPPPQSNTAKVVMLTIVGTLAVLAVGAIGFRFLRNDSVDNSNINTNFNSNIENVNTNLNTNIGFDTNFNFNMNANFNTNSLSNINTNTNTRTPTPTPRPSPSSTPSPSPTPDDDGTPTPTRTPAPTQTPIDVRPPSTPSPRMNPLPTNRPANGGVLNGRAVSLPAPAYPPIAKQMRASGEVRVQIAVDERGNVISARAVSGHPLLRQSAETAARRSKIRSNGQSELGELVYNFRSN